MILTMDVGNTNIKTALFDGVEMKKYWRLSTSSTHTSDEYGFLLSGLLERDGIDRSDIEGIVQCGAYHQFYTGTHVQELFRTVAHDGGSRHQDRNQSEI